MGNMKTNFFTIIYLCALFLITHNNLANCLETRLSALEEQQKLPLVVVNKLTDLCLTSELGKDAFLSKCNGFASQLWFEQLDENKSIVLTNRENGMVLANNKGQITQEIYRGTKNQFFDGELSKKHQGFFSMLNKQSKLCMQHSTQGQISESNCVKEDESQLFKFVQFKLLEHQKITVHAIGQLLIHQKTGLCVTKSKYSLNLSECQGNEHQLWFNEKRENNFAISANHNGQFISVRDSEAVLSDKNDKFNLFSEIPQKNNTISLKSTAENLCLGNDEDDQYDIAIKSDECGPDGAEQQFKFVDLTNYHFFDNHLFQGDKKYKFLMRWVFLKNQHTGTCLKFNGNKRPVTHEKCQNLKEYHWKIMNINHRKFYITTKDGEYVLAPKMNKLKTGVRIVAVKYNPDKITEEEYIKIRAQSNMYDEFRLEYAASDLCFEYDKNGPIVTQGECFCTANGQLIVPEI